ncbi:MAG: hypothetical protein ACJAVK_001672 [Akkermansiaceae bacterium]|jgi:hypothetical protein
MKIPPKVLIRDLEQRGDMSGKGPGRVLGASDHEGGDDLDRSSDGDRDEGEDAEGGCRGRCDLADGSRGHEPDPMGNQERGFAQVKKVCAGVSWWEMRSGDEEGRGGGESLGQEKSRTL